MPRWPSSLERKRLTRLNIIRHRQNILKHLEEINDTVLKPRIKLEPKDIEHYELYANNQKTELEIKPKVKEEVDQNKKKKKNDDDDDDEDDEYNELRETSECSDDLISIGSHEFWNEGYQTSEDSLVSSRRRSKRLNTDKHDSQKKRNKQNDFEYDLDSVLSIADSLGDPHSHTSRASSSSSVSSKPSREPAKRFREHEQRITHNAKERACRERIAMMFLDLRKYCSYLNTNKRNPSKHSILLAAKKECDLLRAYERKLSYEKLKLTETKIQLQKKLNTLMLK